MLWTLDFDDYLGGFCDEGPFPLANAIKSVFDEYTTPSSELVSNTTVLTQVQTSEDNLTLHEYDTEYFSTTNSNYSTKQTTLVDLNNGMLESIDHKKIHGITYEILNAPYIALSNSLKSNHTHNLSSIQLRARTNSVNKLQSFMTVYYFFQFIYLIC